MDNSRMFSDVTEEPKLAGMTAHCERIQRMAPGNDITFEGHGALVCSPGNQTTTVV